MKLQLWDTAGQEKFRGLTKMYYRDADAAVVVYDSSYYDSFKNAQDWVKELHDAGLAHIEIFLAGNKCDLEDERRVPLREVMAYAKEIGGHWGEISAKKNLGVEKMFQDIGRRLHEKTADGRLDEVQLEYSARHKGTVRVGRETELIKKKS